MVSPRTLKELRNINKNQNLPTLIQTANLNDPDLYSIKKYKELIDHILISKSLKLKCGQLQRVDSGPLSDHYAIKLDCSSHN